MMQEVLVYRSPFEAWLWATTAGNVVLLIGAAAAAVAGTVFIVAWVRTSRRIEETRRRIERGMRR